MLLRTSSSLVTCLHGAHVVVFARRRAWCFHASRGGRRRASRGSGVLALYTIAT